MDTRETTAEWKGSPESKSWPVRRNILDGQPTLLLVEPSGASITFAWGPQRLERGAIR